MTGISDAAHLCIDMQNIFAKGGVWETPWMERVLPASRTSARGTGSGRCSRVSSRRGKPQDRRGQWQAYFTKWNARHAATSRPARSISYRSSRAIRHRRLSSTSPPIRHSSVHGSVICWWSDTSDGGGVGRGDRRLRALHRARRGRSRLPRRHRAGRAVQLFRHRPRCIDDHVPDAVSRADRSGQAKELFDLWRPE